MDAAEYHQKKVAQRSLEMNEIMLAMMGGPSKAEAKKILGEG